MTEPRIVDLAAALRDRVRPTVGVWNRLEGRPRTVDFGRALRAEVRDPLWMLTRQWQLGEFRGADAGSPVTATYAVAAAPLTRFAPGDGQPEPLPPNRPMEAVAERRALPFGFGAEAVSFDLRLAIGRRWLKLVATAPDLRHLREQYVTRYPIALPDPTGEADVQVVAHPEVWAYMQAVAGRRMDGYLLYQHITSGGAASDGIDHVPPPHRPELDALGGRLVSWFDGLIDQPAGDAAWDPRRLEHRFAVAGPAPAVGGSGEAVLAAAEYGGGDLDWSSFSVDDSGTTLGGAGAAPAPTVRTVFPAPVRFSGMPLPRWWAVEDGRTNFAAITPDSTDLARLVFLEFALVFSNDWYQLPCDLPAGTLARIAGLAVTDVFGQRLWVTPGGTGDNQDWQRWSMFTLAPADGTGQVETSLLLPAGLAKIATGPALEEVSLIRDENANLVWGVEATVRTTTGESRPGAETAAETLTQRLRLHPPQPPDDPRAPLAYELMTSVPENWIPFIPVHVPNDNRSIQLQRAAMPSVADGTPVRPRTALLREGFDDGRTYFLNEEEVPQAGTRVEVAYRRARWRDGRVVVWLAARRGVGRGEGHSGLAFDALVDTPTGD